MHWVVLIISALFESVWATALGMSDGLTRPIPALVFLIALALSMFGLAFAVKKIPIGTAYAVWVGIGAVLTVSYAILTGSEPATFGRLLCIAGIVGAIVGLKLVEGKETRRVENPES